MNDDKLCSYARHEASSYQLFSQTLHDTITITWLIAGIVKITALQRLRMAFDKFLSARSNTGINCYRVVKLNVKTNGYGFDRITHFSRENIKNIVKTDLKGIGLPCSEEKSEVIKIHTS